jgi:hypothetical protein
MKTRGRLAVKTAVERNGVPVAWPARMALTGDDD